MARRRRVEIERCFLTERAVGEAAKLLGRRLRRNDLGLPGKPHLTSKTKRVAIFTVDCHTYEHPIHEHRRSRFGDWYYRYRDLNIRELNAIQEVFKERGWHTEIFWSCEAENLNLLVERLKALFERCEATK